MVVRLDLECDPLGLPQGGHAPGLARALEHSLARARQALEQARRVLVAAVLRPEQREDRELEVVGVALEQLADARVLGIGEAERLVQRLIGDPRQIAESSVLTGRVEATL